MAVQKTWNDCVIACVALAKWHILNAKQSFEKRRQDFVFTCVHAWAFLFKNMMYLSVVTAVPSRLRQEVGKRLQLKAKAGSFGPCSVDRRDPPSVSVSHYQLYNPCNWIMPLSAIISSCCGIQTLVFIKISSQEWVNDQLSLIDVQLIYSHIPWLIWAVVGTLNTGLIKYRQQTNLFSLNRFRDLQRLFISEMFYLKIQL